MERPVPHRRPARAGFTLIELLVAILIIAALLAILLPAVQAAFRKGKEAQVAAEINNMATALASFKNTYGDFPPSRVLLCEQGYASILSSTTISNTLVTSLTGNTPPSDSNITDMTVGQLATRSLGYMRKFWPRADFLSNPISGTTPATVGQFNDFNGNQVADAYYILSGSECLAFFLGGIPTRELLTDATGVTPVTGVSGFSKSPKFPFVDNFTVASNRTVPNYEFNNGRLIDMDGDGIPSYIDPFDVTPGNRRSYAYFSAYGGNAYDPNDINGYGHHVAAGAANWEYEDDDSTVVERGFAVSFPPLHVVSPGPNPYTAGVPLVLDAKGNVVSTQAWINSSTFQLFAAGQDRQFGLGGTYKQNATGGTGGLPILPSGSDSGNIHSDDTTGVRNRELDNLTNFSGGRLQ